ncbi:MAG: hypothetical protein AAB263_11360 [Planctomycetota bacterium]
MIRTLLLLIATVLMALPAADVTKPAEATQPPLRAKPTVAVVPIEGVIDPHRAGQFERALDKALAGKPDFIVIRLDTPGGRLDSAMEMLQRELKIDGQGTKLIAFVKGEAFSAGALLSFGCSRIYMTKEGYLGDIGVIFQSQDPAEPIKYAPEKMETVVRTLLRQCGSHHGWDQAKLQKMTARNQELWQINLEAKPTFVIEDDLPRFLSEHKDVERKDGKLLRGTDVVGFMVAGKDRLLTYSATEAVEAGMATALVKDIDDVYRALGADPAQVRSFEPTQNELFAETLGGWAPILAALALLCVVMEFKMPAGGLWLIGAAAFGGLFLICQYWLALAGAPEIILILLGVAAIIVDVFVFPTGGMVAIIGLIAVAGGLILAFVPDNIQFNPSADGWGSAIGYALTQSILALVVMTIGIVVAIAALPKTRAMQRLASETAVDGTSAGAVEAEARGLVGTRVRARTALRPSGYVTVNNHDVSATTEHGELIEAGDEVVIIEARFGEMIVKRASSA